MVGWIGKGRKPVWSNLFLSGHVQHCVHCQRVFAVPDVVQSGTAFPCGPDLPRCVLWLRQTVLAEFLIGRVQTERRRDKTPVHLLRRDRVEVAAYEQRNVGAGVLCGTTAVFLDLILEVAQKVGALGAAEPLPAGTGLQVGHGHTQASSSAAATKHHHHSDLWQDSGASEALVSSFERESERNPTHLVGGNPHGGEPYVHALQELEPGLIKEQRAAVGPVVALHVQTRGPRLRAEVAAVTQAYQNGLEGVIIVVDLLQTQDVRSVGEDLLQDEVLPAGPFEGLQGTLDKTVKSLTQS